MITVGKLKEYAKYVQVLYVEDDIDIREAVYDFLSRFFPVIDLAENGEEGFEKYQKKDYDIIITDINMPKINGIEMIHAIKQINEEQKIIVTSAYNEIKYLMKLIDEGVDNFVLKPFNNKKFLVVLYKICEFIYNKKQHIILQKQISEKAIETQIIVDMIEHGIVVIEKGVVIRVNQQFLVMAGYDNLKLFQTEIKYLSSLFERHKGYVDVYTNEELIKLLQSDDNKLHKIIMKKELEDVVYLLKYKKIDEEDKCIISFTDITQEEQFINLNTKTGLPNIYAATANIEHRLDNNLSFFIDIIRIENIDKIVKWYGRHIRNNVDINVANVFNAEKKRLVKYGIFAAYYGHNKFLLVRDEQMHKLAETVVNKISYISAIGDKLDVKPEMYKIHYKPITISILVQSNDNIDDIMKKIDDNFDKIFL